MARRPVAVLIDVRHAALLRSISIGPSPRVWPQSSRRKAVLIVLFVPSVDRDPRPIDQDLWTERALEVLGTLFGGATAFPRARGVWRDDEREQRLVWDEPVIIHCYASASDVRREGNQRALGGFCTEMGRATNQGEVGLVVDNVYHAVRPE